MTKHKEPLLPVVAGGLFFFLLSSGDGDDDDHGVKIEDDELFQFLDRPPHPQSSAFGPLYFLRKSQGVPHESSTRHRQRPRSICCAVA
uniref:Putative secreted protein n=1 Tax=Anopheles darlingi TaxID=43151 RepID=A0A2M4DDL6_ANODA